MKALILFLILAMTNKVLAADTVTATCALSEINGTTNNIHIEMTVAGTKLDMSLGKAVQASALLPMQLALLGKLHNLLLTVNYFGFEPNMYKATGEFLADINLKGTRQKVNLLLIYDAWANPAVRVELSGQNLKLTGPCRRK